MATQVQFRRGTTTQNNAFTGAIAELTVDTEAKTIRLHDGSTAGGGAIVATLAGTQTFTNKTLSSNSVWQGTAVGLAYGGTNASLTAVAGGVVYSGASALAISAAGTSGQVLTSAGASAPTWTSQSSLVVGTATVATTATNIAGGSAGNLIIQLDTNQTTFVAAGAAGTFLKSTGASTAPEFAAGNITIGSTTVSFGDTSTSLAGLTSIDATSGATSFFATSTSPVAFAGATTLTLGYGSTASSTTNISTGAVGSGNTKTINIGTGGAAGSTTNINLGDGDGGTVTVNKDLVVTGDLTVNGTTTTINSTTLDVDDINITVAKGAANAAAANGAGLTVDGASATILYTSSGDKWSFNKPIDVTGGATFSAALTYGGVTLSNSVTGTGSMVLSTSPSLTTPSLGVATVTSVNKVAITAPATGSTLTIADGKTLTASNTLTFTGTDSSSVAFGAGGTVLYSSGALGTPSSGTLTNTTGLPISTGVSGLGTGVATFLGTPSSANLAAAITDETGSGALVFASSPSLTTPTIDGGGANFSGSTSGSLNLKAAAAAGTGVIVTIPATTGTVVTTGDSSTVTNTMLAGSIANAKLQNSTISGIALGSNLATLTIGTGLSGTSYNGGTAVTIANTGVTALTTSSGLSTNTSATGAVSITNTGVTSIVAGTGISISGATGAVTVTNTITNTNQLTNGAGYITAVPNSNTQVSSLGVGTGASGTTGEIRATNNITAFYSDERLKTDITEISGALDKLMQLRGVTFRANELAESFGYSAEKEQVGVIAQDVEKVLPQIVVPAPFDIMQLQEGVEISRSGENYKTVHYDKLVPLLIQAIKEQQIMIEELQKKVG